MRKQISAETWLDLTEAADYLGVHFSTLRRWADAGEISCLRTPGGRRRFSLGGLDAFLRARRQGGEALQIQPLQELAINHARSGIRSLPDSEQLFARLSADQRAGMKGTGHRLMALLLQYNSRPEGGEAYLAEGQRIMRDYGQVCRQIGLSLPETVRIFLFFRRSILDAVHETGFIGGRDDQLGMSLYQRTNEFLDDLIVELIGGFQALDAQNTP
jgi:excisionase family DNA binding protein